MEKYLDRTRYAAESLFEAYRHDKAEIQNSRCEMQSSSEKVIGATDIDEATRYLEQNFEYLHNYNMAKIRQIDRASALPVLSGAILQLAKQGISFVYGDPNRCPVGRDFGSESLKNIIWQGRNQALHYEEDSFRPAVISCFNNLANEYGEKFNLISSPSSQMSLHILDLLKWHTIIAYEEDMLSLG